MRDKTREIDILYFFNYLKSKIAVIALAVFVCAGLIGAYDYKRQKGVRDESAKDRLKAAMELFFLLKRWILIMMISKALKMQR